MGGHGLTDGAVEGFPGGAPVELEVLVNGRSLERLSRPNQKGWAGKEAELTLQVSTTSSGGRHYCFDARIEP